MVENDAAGFARLGRDAHHPANLLNVQSAGLGRSQQQSDFHTRLIKADADDVAGGQHEDTLFSQIGVHALALFNRGAALHRVSGNARLTELFSDVASVFDIYTKGDRALAGDESLPFLHDSDHQFGGDRRHFSTPLRHSRRAPF